MVKNESLTCESGLSSNTNERIACGWRWEVLTEVDGR